MTEHKSTFFTKDIIVSVRWFPTASNKQDYAMAFNGHIAHVFSVGTSIFNLCDAGISMAHIEVACNANKLDGHWEKLENVCEGVPTNWIYLASIICE